MKNRILLALVLLSLVTISACAGSLGWDRSTPLPGYQSSGPGWEPRGATYYGSPCGG